MLGAVMADWFTLVDATQFQSLVIFCFQVAAVGMVFAFIPALIGTAFKCFTKMGDIDIS